MRGESCLVFGGGKVAYRKVQALLRRGARVTCISKEFCGPFKKNAGARLPLRLKHMRGSKINLNGARLVIAATSNRKFNERVARLSRRKRIWVNVVDDPELCDFTVPAVVERGPLQIAISTGGTSPLFARRLREELEKVIHPSTGRMLEKIGKIRGKWVKKKNS